eukprot:2706907-Pyramimonas_sp.AAC.1
MPGLGSDRSNRRLQVQCPEDCGACGCCARHLGARHHMKDVSSAELDFRIRATHAGWSVIGLRWHERGLHRLVRELFLGFV